MASNQQLNKSEKGGLSTKTALYVGTLSTNTSLSLDILSTNRAYQI